MGFLDLLCALIVLALRFLGRLPLFTPPAGSGHRGLLARLRGGARAIWNAPVRVGRPAGQPGVVLDILTLGLGTGLGFYTGVLLSTISARPLWTVRRSRRSSSYRAWRAGQRFCACLCLRASTNS